MYASGSNLFYQPAGQGERGETEGDRGGLGQSVKLLHVPKSWLVEAVDWLAFY